MREINGGLARCWETNTEKSAVCVGAIPLHSRQICVIFVPFFPLCLDIISGCIAVLWRLCDCVWQAGIFFKSIFKLPTFEESLPDDWSRKAEVIIIFLYSAEVLATMFDTMKLKWLVAVSLTVIKKDTVVREVDVVFSGKILTSIEKKCLQHIDTLMIAVHCFLFVRVSKESFPCPFQKRSCCVKWNKS